MKRPNADGAASQRLITRRTAVLGALQLVFVGALGTRMQFLQLDQADQFRLLAEENRINIRLIPPARGEVFDRNGIALARNVPSYRIVIVREDAGDVDAVLKRLRAIIPLVPEEVARALAEMQRSAPFLPVTVADKVDWEDLSRVSVNAPALPGVTPEVGLSRVYPRGSDFAHVLGYVGPVSDYDLARIDDPDQLLRIPRFQIGKVGVEAKAEGPLRGKGGAKRVEVNATGRVMRELDRREGTPGSDLQLTVDADLQSYVQARLGNESASAIVMDVKSGDLVAIASAPTFDPNLFVRGISNDDYAALTENSRRPLASKSVQGSYPPGSTFKMIVAMAALEDGLIEPEETTYCPGHLEVSGRKFHCWKRAGHGHVNLQDSLKQSCDVYFYDLALKVGIEKITAMANRFGLGIRHDVPMSAVAKGLTPTKTLEKSNARHRLGHWRYGQRVHRPRLYAGFATAIVRDGGTASLGQCCATTTNQERRRHRTAHGRRSQPWDERKQPAHNPQRHVRCGQRPARYSLWQPYYRRCNAHGGKDRHKPGAQHHHRRACDRRHQKRRSTVGTPRPRVVCKLCAL